MMTYRFSPIIPTQSERLNTSVNNSHVERDRAFCSGKSLLLMLRISKLVDLGGYMLEKVAGFVTELS